MADQQIKPELGFNPEKVRARYKYERDRRLRDDGQDQYVEVSGKFARYADHDPNADPSFSREPLNVDAEVVIVGGGFGGLMAAARLREAGVVDVRIIEIGSDIGGTWYWNRYPGAQCDVESYIYLPLLEETGYMPQEKYSYQPELYAHTQRLARHFDLYPLALLQTRVTEVKWGEDLKRWTICTDRGDALRARFVINATGPANRPKLPGIPGLDSFEGHTFHTARWDYDYTGGDTHGGLYKLADKRVAVIGTGATAIQVVPHLGRDAQHLYVFQRTPSSVDLRGNSPTDHDWAAGLQPGWQKERQDNFNAILGGEDVEVDLVDDMWTDTRNYRLTGEQTLATGDALEEAMLQAELADMRKMHAVRKRVDDLVDDKRAAETLKTWYPRHCKRPTFHDDYLPTFNRPNVTLVDTSASLGVERITPRSIVANGIEYEVDCIVFATGFEITTGFNRSLPINIRGRDDQSLGDRWSAQASTFHGYAVHGFPNWFFLGSNQNGLSANYTSMLAEQAAHLTYIIKETRARGALTIQPTAEAEAEWVRTIHELSILTIKTLSACTPGYYNNEGKIGQGQGRGLAEVYGLGLNAFNRLLQDWRADGHMAGLEFELSEKDVAA